MSALIETAIQPGPVSLPPASALESCGAVCVFHGQTRAEEDPQLGELLALEYEAYEPMASSMLNDLALEIAQEFQLASLRIVHATGRVALGETSVIVEAQAGHRDAAFTGARAAIDRLKQSLPIFKVEHWKKGTKRPAGTTPVS